MISRATWNGGAYEMSFSGLTPHPPHAGRLIVATATAPGSFLGPYALNSTDWAHYREGEWWVIWNRGATSFTYATTDLSILETMAQDDVLFVDLYDSDGAGTLAARARRAVRL